MNSSTSAFTIRNFRPEDLEIIKRLTVDSFNGVSLEQNVENALGILNGHDWRWRKARHIDEDVAANPAGVFVAESNGRVVGSAYWASTLHTLHKYSLLNPMAGSSATSQPSWTATQAEAGFPILP